MIIWIPGNKMLNKTSYFSKINRSGQSGYRFW